MSSATARRLKLSIGLAATAGFVWLLAGGARRTSAETTIQAGASGESRSKPWKCTP